MCTCSRDFLPPPLPAPEYIFHHFRHRQFVRVANAKEAAKAARNMVVFVKGTLDLAAMTMGEDAKRADPYKVAIGGERPC